VPDPWQLAQFAAALLAVDPAGTGGAVVRAAAGPVRDRWLGLLRQWMPAQSPWCTVPLNIPDSRLMGGMDLAATLAAGKPRAERGLLAAAHGGLAVLSMAERISSATAARIAAVLDSGEVQLEREGLALRAPSRFGIVALDEGLDDEESAPAALRERAAFEVRLEGLRISDAATILFTPEDLARARQHLLQVESSDELLPALNEIALRCGIRSLRAPLLAARVARASAALQGRRRTEESDLTLAASLVLGHRATCLPQRVEPETAPTAQASTDSLSSERASEEQSAETASQTPGAPVALEDRVLEAVATALAPEVLASLALRGQQRGTPGSAGRSGQEQSGGARGRPLGTRRGLPRRGERLDLVATLYAAAPWQAWRRREAADNARPFIIARDDLRSRRYRQRSRSVTLFVVDASGSSALHRLAEAKGAVELLLAECYVRRDQVALIAFRGGGAETLLPPTRSLARARRSLAALPGGGGTPLAAAIDAAAGLAGQVQRSQATPLVVFFTDGRANLARDGSQGRVAGEADAAVAARQYLLRGLNTLFIDTSPRPHPRAQEFARQLGARYLALPHADASGLARLVQHSRGEESPR
jgi:magnesium chelatase subunit D